MRRAKHPTNLPRNAKILENHEYLEPIVIHDVSTSRGKNLSEARSIFVNTRRLM